MCKKEFVDASVDVTSKTKGFNMQTKKFYQPLSGNEMPRFAGTGTFMRLPA
ncbi:MAG: hypothetical protein ACJAZP_004020, partial [Psychromonas sp.]